jgi:hypothetical protein
MYWRRLRPGISCARSYRTLRDGSFEGRLTRHFVPGYDRTVPPGHTGTAAAVKTLKMSKLQPRHFVPGSCLATIGLSLRDKNHSPVEAPRTESALMG